MATPASLPVEATVWITMQYTQSCRSQMKQQDYVKRHILPEISQLYTEDGLM